MMAALYKKIAYFYSEKWFSHGFKEEVCYSPFIDWLVPSHFNYL